MTTALLLMDFQVAILDRAGVGSDVVDRANAAADAARAGGLPVIFVKLGFRAGHPEIAGSNKIFSALAAGGRFGPDDPGSALDPRLDPAPADLVVVKRRVSAFSGSDLELLLRARGITSLALCGVATSGVVLSTLRQAADLDYELTVLEDACFDPDAEVHRVLIEKVFPRQAAVDAAAAWCDRW
jgi:nicotinamidase-related amidase